MKYEIDLNELELLELELIKLELIELIKRLEGEKTLDKVIILYDGKEHIYNLCDGDKIDERWMNMDVFGYETSEDDDDIYWARINLDDIMVY